MIYGKGRYQKTRKDLINHKVVNTKVETRAVESLSPTQLDSSGKLLLSIKSNWDAKRSPTPFDNYSDGYSEGSFWLNKLDGSQYTCIETNKFQTKWVLINSASSGREIRSEALDVILNNEDMIFEINIDKIPKISSVLEIRIINTVSIIRGWQLDLEQRLIYLPYNKEVEKYILENKVELIYET